MNKFIVKNLEELVESRFTLDLVIFATFLAAVSSAMFWMILAMLTDIVFNMPQVFDPFITIALLTSITFSLIPFYWGDQRINAEIHSNEAFALFLALFPLYFFYKFFFIHLLHRIIPGKEARDKEVQAYLDSVNFVKDKEEVKDFHIKSAFISNPDKFLKDHFQLTQSFKRFFMERITYKGEVSEEKLVFLMLVPRVKTMPIDNLREIILSLNLIPTVGLDAWRMKSLIKKDLNIDGLFSQFSLEEIKSVFTRSLNPHDYVGLLDNTASLELKESPLTPGKTLQDVIDASPATKVLNETRLYHPYLTKVSSVLPNYSVKVLITKDDYVTTSEMFVNCVKSYYDKPKSNVFTLTQSGHPVACIEMNNHKITEINGVNNIGVPERVRAEIQDAIKEVQNAK